MLLSTLTDKGVTISLTDSGGVAVQGLNSLPPAQADALRDFIRRHKDALVNELGRGRTTEPKPDIAMLELREYARMGMLSLEMDQGQVVGWSISDRYGPDDRAFVQGLVDEANSTLEFVDRFCCPPGGWCKYYVPKQIPGQDPNAGLCEHPDIPDTPDIVTVTKRGKENRRKAEGSERLNWIPDLKACPGARPLTRPCPPQG